MFRLILCSLLMVGACACFADAVQEKTGDKGKIDKHAKEAKITKLDVKKGTVAVKMHIKSKDEDKDVEKTFKLAENIEYMDSTGKVATIDIFTAGDLVLIVEREGTITKMAKKDKSGTKKTPDSK